jgi:hypothetical protein
MKYYSQKKFEKKLGKKLFPKTHLDNRRSRCCLTVSASPMIGDEMTIGKTYIFFKELKNDNDILIANNKRQQAINIGNVLRKDLDIKIDGKDVEIFEKEYKNYIKENTKRLFYKKNFR